MSRKIETLNGVQVVYLIGPTQRGHTNTVKIGVSDNPKKRLQALQTGHPLPLFLFYAGVVFSCDTNKPVEALPLERYLHCKYFSNRLKGEWFRLHAGSVKAAIDPEHRFRFDGVLCRVEWWTHRSL